MTSPASVQESILPWNEFMALAIQQNDKWRDRNPSSGGPHPPDSGASKREELYALSGKTELKIARQSGEVRLIYKWNQFLGLRPVTRKFSTEFFLHQHLFIAHSAVQP